MRAGGILAYVAGMAGLVGMVGAVPLNTNIRDSILAAQVLISGGLMDYYTGNNTGKAPGMFSDPYYWWEAGVAWGTMLDYGFYSGNDTYNDLVKSSILFQSGDNWNFMTYNQTSTEGNDDQAFWGITAMAAAEKNFTAPGEGWPDSWLYFAQATFNTMAARWDTEHCGGGLRWQIYTWNAGYNYKNLVSNGCLFHLAARLYRFTGNETFLTWANKAWDWLESVHLINATAGPKSNALYVYDGASIDQNCSQIAPYEWTYDQGLLLAGTAFLYNTTADDKWLDRLTNLWERAQVFFTNNTHNNGVVMYEAACQPRLNSTGGWSANRCNNDQRCFKGIFSRFLGLTMLMVPESKDWMWQRLVDSANAMAGSCSGGTDGHTCGLNWLIGGWDNMFGLGEQISALDLLNTLQIDTQRGPFKASELFDANHEGSRGRTENGTQVVYGYGDAGLNSTSIIAKQLRLGTSDVAGAGVLTAVVLILITAASVFLL